MELSIIKSKIVCKDNDVFLIHVGFKNYDLGFQVQSWGLRIMLIWWHLCIHK
jgi:hypothetical protein